MSAFSKNLVSLVGVFSFAVLAGCTINTGSNSDPVTPGNDPELTSGEQPLLDTSSAGSKIVGFAQKFGEPMEAWEVQSAFNKTFLNYSRFSYGTTNYKGQSAQVCMARVGSYKYVGVSENTIRLKKAMLVVTRYQTGTTPSVISCTAYEAMTAKDSRMASIDKVFDSL